MGHGYFTVLANGYIVTTETLKNYLASTDLTNRSELKTLSELYQQELEELNNGDPKNCFWVKDKPKYAFAIALSRWWSNTPLPVSLHFERQHSEDCENILVTVDGHYHEMDARGGCGDYEYIDNKFELGEAQKQAIWELFPFLEGQPARLILFSYEGS